MNYNQEKQILNFIKVFPPIFILLISVIITIFLYTENKKTFIQEKETIEEEYLKRNKEKIKEEVERVYSYISYVKTTTEKKLKQNIKSRVYEVHAMATTIYDKYGKTKSKDEMIDLMRTTFQNYRYNDGRGYFFWDDKNGVKTIYPLDKNIEGKNFYDYEDARGYKFVHAIAKTVKDKTERFDEYYWYKPNEGKKGFRKISFYKYFEPLDLVIGSGEYYDDYLKEVQKEAFDYINLIRYGKSGYIFIIDYNTIYHSHIRKNYRGKSAIQNNDTVEIKKVIQDVISLAKKGGGFYTYTQNSKISTNKPSTKTSYIKGVQEWSLLIGTGFYHEEIEADIQKRKEFLDTKFNNYITNILIINFLLTIVLIFVAKYISNKLSKKFEKYKEEINSKQTLLYHNSKMAAMGEMLGNIAHQWRQPLSNISISATGMSLQKEAGILSDEMFESNVKNINNSAQYLSQTIEDFRDFFNPNKKLTLCNTQELLKSILNLIKAQYDSNNINIIENIEDINFQTYKNELIQSLINILNNAKDQLLKKNIHSARLIFINIKKEKNNLIFEIKDNAGGIDRNIIDKIFEPYFTTKHKSQGTGIGLYMTEEIIVKHLKGQIEVFNENFTHQNIDYFGATFKITLNLENIKKQDIT